MHSHMENYLESLLSSNFTDEKALLRSVEAMTNILDFKPELIFKHKEKVYSFVFDQLL